MSAKTVLVTGCTSGLGKATALRLNKAGWRVLATARNDSDLKSLGEAGLIPIRLELTDPQSIREAIEEVKRVTGGHLHGLVNNAGYLLFGAVADLSPFALREQFEVNVFGTFELTRGLLPELRDQTGAIVFISSICGRFSFPFLGAYSASKYALEALVDALRRENAGNGLRVQIIEPSVFKTASSARTRAL